MNTEEILKRKFPIEEIEFKVQSAKTNVDRPYAVVNAYVTARAVYNRMDEAFGWDGWNCETRPVELGNERGFIFRFEARGEECVSPISREDVSPLSDYEALKGGVSGAAKRCAVLFGIGRYLYDLPRMYVNLKKGYAKGAHVYVDPKSKETYHWFDPKMPDEFLP